MIGACLPACSELKGRGSGLSNGPLLLLPFIAGIARAQLKRVLKDGTGGGNREESDGDEAEEATTEKPTAALVDHADGLEAGTCDTSAAARAVLPNNSEREERVTRISTRLLHLFYFCGSIFAGPSQHFGLLTPPCQHRACINLN